MEPKKTQVAGYVGTGVAPHAETARITLQNNSEKAWRVVNILLYYERATAPTTAEVVVMRAGLAVNGGTEYNVIMSRYTGAAIGQRGSATLPFPLILWKGDVLKVYTSDASTGGTMNYWATVVYEII